MLDATARVQLLAVARSSLQSLVGPAEPVHEPTEGPLTEPGAAFVSIYSSLGELRGCIGVTEPRSRLTDVVADMARAAGSRDPRFGPIQSSELANLRIEISVLTPPELISGPEHIEIGVHGLSITCGANRGLLLPQVASERGWDPRTFLDRVCEKAGLNPGDWHSPDSVVSRFRAEVFGDNT